MPVAGTPMGSYAQAMTRLAPDNQPSLQARLISRGLRKLVKPRHITRSDIPLLRALMLALTRSQLPGGVLAERIKAPVRGEWLRVAHPRRGRALLYFHGGGFFCGTPQTHRAITGRLAQLLGFTVLALDYRLAPEHPYPAALEDAIAAWQWLLSLGYRPDRVWLGGDSAGGGLALALMLACRERDLPLPAGGLLYSPWTDLTCTAPSITENVARCAWFMPEQVIFAADMYAGRMSREHPLLSPLRGNLSGLPPLLLHVSDSELLRDDSVLLAERARASGVQVQMRVWHGLPHAWPNFAGLMPEGDLCLAESAEVILRTATA